MPNNNINYESYKEERDLILEYNQIKMDDINIVNINGVGVDNVNLSQAVVKTMNMINDNHVHHIMLLNPYKIQKIKSNQELQLISNMADLHLASGAGINWAAKMLKKPLKERVPALSYIMDLIRISEKNQYTIFLVGGKPEITEKAFFNIKKSFPNIRIVGRHGGYFNIDREKSVIEAMRKSQANIILVGLGFPKEDKWIYKIKNKFTNTIFISVGGSFDIISGEIKKAPAYFMKNGLDWLYRILIRPWRIGKLIRVFIFTMQITFTKLFHRR
jgi:N-acetylglucosaminyldiphosphoundecaprenol N-acetyl-beta-D-mannosaminyltransferase